MNANIRIAVVTNIATPYREKQLEQIRMLYPSTFMYFVEEDPFRRWKSEFTPLMKPLPVLWKIGNLYFNKGLYSIVKHHDVIVIGGYDHPSYIYLVLLCRLLKKPYVLLFDGIAPHRINHYKKSGIKHAIRQFIVNGSRAIFGNGKVSKDYFIQVFNYDEQQVYNQFLNMDGTYFLGKLPDKNIIKKKERARYGIEEHHKVVFYSGRLLKRKRVADLVQAISKLNALNQNNTYMLFILGGGGEEDIYQLCSDFDVKFLEEPFKEQSELYRYYFLADALVLPSEDEPWGLVLNDALHAQIPIVASNDCGAATDLIKERANGFISKVGDIDNLSEKIRLACLLPEVTVSETSTIILEDWNNISSANEFDKMIKSIMDK